MAIMLMSLLFCHLRGAMDYFFTEALAFPP